MRDLESTYRMLHVIAHDIIDDVDEILDSGKELSEEEHMFIHLMTNWARSIVAMEIEYSHILKNVIQMDNNDEKPSF